ncbi:hypothetical protein ACFLRW_07675 [Acidobacteriota bacterium]
MKLKNINVIAIIFGLIIGILSIPNLNAQVQDPSKVVEELAREFIPAEVLSIIKSGLDTRTPNTGIPFDIFKSLYLPAQQNMHGIFFFKCKNADLDFQGAAQPAGEEEVSAFESTPTQLISRKNIYLYFKQLDGDYEKQIYVPFNQKADGLTYAPDEEVVYSIGYPLPAGDYVLAMALSSPDYSKVGTQYFEFSLPNAAAFSEIDITPPFFINQMNEMSTVEMQTQVHKRFFTYSLYQMDPNINHLFSPGDNLDIFFYIFGIQANAEGKYDIEIDYSISQEEELVIRYATTKYEYPVVSQPLPMKKTVIVKTTDPDGNVTEKTETQDLEVGTYTFSIEIRDNLSGKSTTKSVDIEVR